MPEPEPVPAQVPFGISKHPAVNLIPLLKEEVAPEERLIEPPVIESPSDDANPPAVIPPANVEVAVEVALMLENSTYPDAVRFLEAREP